MELSLLTPVKKVFSGKKVTEIFAPGIEGSLNILPDHANFLTQLETGVLRWKNDGSGDWNAAAVSFGWLEVFEGKISILADVADVSEAIDMSRAQAAERLSKAKLEEGGLNDANFKKYELKMKRAMARQEASS